MAQDAPTVLTISTSSNPALGRMWVPRGCSTASPVDGWYVSTFLPYEPREARRGQGHPGSRSRVVQPQRRGSEAPPPPACRTHVVLCC